MNPRSGSHFESIRPAVLLPAISLLVSLAVAAAWIASGPLQLQSTSARLGLFAAAMVVIAGSGCLVMQALQKSQKRAIRALKLLCQTNYLELEEGQSVASLLDRNLSPAWSAALTQLGEQLHEQSLRLTDAEQARAKAEVRLNRQADEHGQLKEILDHLQDPVVAINSFHELSYLNESAASLFQISAEARESAAVENLQRCEQLVSLLLETNQHKSHTVRTAEAPIGMDAGEQQWYRIRCRTLSGAGTEGTSAEATGAVAVLRDINEQKHMQRRNAEFVSAVSHEMKTPLTGIKAYVELLADGDAEDTETREEFLGVINSQADRLQRLIENMLDLARIEAGVVEVSKHQISLNELLERALEVVAPSAERKSINLVNDLSPMYLGVLADHDMLLQAAINLLSNAIKYTPDSGQVTLRSYLLDSDIAFEVVDTGVGMNPEDCRRVFDKFYRVKKDSAMAPGTGLGLPLAKHIVEDVHGGRLDLESEEGVGSTFRITLTEQVSNPVLV